MKRDILFVCVFVILGILAGFACASILMMIGMTDFSNMLLTLAEKAELESVQTGIFWYLSRTPTLLSAVLIIASVITFAFFLYQMNPHIRSVLSRGAKKAKVAVVIFASLVLLFLLVVILARTPVGFLTSGSFPGASADIVHGLLLVLATGVLWLIAGETGWAGDFSSWKPDATVKEKKLVFTFLMGAAVGLAGACIAGLFDWSFKTYFLLVAEVLAGSPDPTALGFRLLAYALMFMLALSLGIIAGFVIVLAPRNMTVKERLVRLVIPAILLAIYTTVAAGTYQNAQRKYDLGKQNLASAAGVPEKGKVSKTIILFNPGKPVLQEWPLQAEGSGYAGSYTVELTYENLEKIKAYLEGHKEGSVFRYAGLDILMKGYHRFWDVEKGLDQMFRNSRNQILPRALLLARLQRLPVTSENEKYLRPFADEAKWYAGRDWALRLARAFMHFGYADEAKVWAEKAKTKGADLSKEGFLHETVFTNGTISAIIRLNGPSLAKTKVALIADKKLKKMDVSNLLVRLVDVRLTDDSGKVTFANLGRGEYALAVMLDKETLPYDLPPGQLKIENAPGTIKLDTDSPSKDLGVISIMTK